MRDSKIVWDARTLEWLTEMPGESWGVRSIPEIDSRYPLWEQPNFLRDLDQGRFYLPDAEEGRREMLVTSSIDAEPRQCMRIPGPTFITLFAAIAVLAVGVAPASAQQTRMQYDKNGRAYYERCLQLLSDLEEAEEMVGNAMAAPRGFTVEDLVKMERVGSPALSPDATRVVYTVRATDMDKNRGNTQLWMIDLRAAKPVPQQLTSHESSSFDPEWSASGDALYFLSSRSGSAQVWRLPAGGGEAVKVTNLPVDVDSFHVSPKGDRLAVTMAVFRDCADLACTKARLDADAQDKSSGRVYDRLFVRPLYALARINRNDAVDRGYDLLAGGGLRFTRFHTAARLTCKSAARLAPECVRPSASASCACNCTRSASRTSSRSAAPAS